MLRTNRISGFTLIELMVVIVIIGVLASLAIPRFTEASAKAKAAEGPRVLSSFESAFLAAASEKGAENVTADDLIFDPTSVSADSKWFDYASGANDLPNGILAGVTESKLGKVESGKSLITTYESDTDTFAHTSDDDVNFRKLVPNFFKD